MTQAEPSINFKCDGGAEFDAQLDGDGDLYIGVTNDTTTAMYLNSLQAFELRNWLTKVLAEFPQLCPHGYTLANLRTGADTCEPCSRLETGVRCAFAGCEAIVEGAQVCGRHTGMWP